MYNKEKKAYLKIRFGDPRDIEEREDYGVGYFRYTIGALRFLVAIRELDEGFMDDNGEERLFDFFECVNGVLENTEDWNEAKAGNFVTSIDLGSYKDNKRAVVIGSNIVYEDDANAEEPEDYKLLATKLNMINTGLKEITFVGEDIFSTKILGTPSQKGYICNGILDSKVLPKLSGMDCVEINRINRLEGELSDKALVLINEMHKSNITINNSDIVAIQSAMKSKLEIDNVNAFTIYQGMNDSKLVLGEGVKDVEIDLDSYHKCGKDTEITIKCPFYNVRILNREDIYLTLNLADSSMTCEEDVDYFKERFDGLSNVKVNCSEKVKRLISGEDTFEK